MKALRIILIILGVIVAAILIIPLFAPATVTVSAETEIALEPEQVFPFVASYTDREAWDPWAEMDTTTIVTVVPAEGFVGSTYQWEGEQLGTGRMEVLSVVENEYIQSSLWFGDVATASLVEWTFEPADGGTRVTWSFSEETSYPFERLRMMIGRMFLQQSFENGLANLKEYLEANPPVVSMLVPMTFPEKGVLQAVHTGPYEEFKSSYNRLMEYAAENGIQLSGLSLWQTRIAFVLEQDGI